MVYQYNTQLVNSFFDAIMNQLSVAGVLTLKILAGNGATIATLPFSGTLVKSRTTTEIQLNPPLPVQADMDATATTASLVNGEGVTVVTFDVGSATTNPDAVLILSSTSIFKGGTISVTSVKLTA